MSEIEDSARILDSRDSRAGNAPYVDFADLASLPVANAEIPSQFAHSVVDHGGIVFASVEQRSGDVFTVADSGNSPALHRDSQLFFHLLSRAHASEWASLSGDEKREVFQFIKDMATVPPNSA